MKMRGNGGSTMQKRKTISVRYRIIPLALAAAALLCSCTNTLSEEVQKPVNEGGGTDNLKIPKAAL